MGNAIVVTGSDGKAIQDVGIEFGHPLPYRCIYGLFNFTNYPSQGSNLSYLANKYGLYILYAHLSHERIGLFMQRGTHLFSTALDLFFLDCEARRLTDQTLCYTYAFVCTAPSPVTRVSGSRLSISSIVVS